MPQEPKPSPPFDRGFWRNLFVEADPDLDALIESTADEPARAAGVRRRGRGLVVLAEQHRSPHAGRAHDVRKECESSVRVWPTKLRKRWRLSRLDQSDILRKAQRDGSDASTCPY